MSWNKSDNKNNGIRVSRVSSLLAPKSKSFNHSENLNVIEVTRHRSFSSVQPVPEHYSTIENGTRLVIHIGAHDHRVVRENFTSTSKYDDSLVRETTRKNVESSNPTTPRISNVVRSKSQSQLVQESTTNTSERPSMISVTIGPVRIAPEKCKKKPRNKKIDDPSLPDIDGTSERNMSEISTADKSPKCIINQILVSDKLDISRVTRIDAWLGEADSNFSGGMSRRILSPKASKKRHQKRRKCSAFCACSPCCILLSAVGLILIGTVIAVLILKFVNGGGKQITITTTSTTTTTTSVTSTTSTTTTTTSVTSTTTTGLVCGSSCINQSWISSADLLAEWPFDNSFADLTTNYNGVPSAIPPNFVTGLFGQAAAFNVSAYQAIHTPYIPLYNVSFSVDAWIYVTGFPNPSDHSIAGLCPLQITSSCLHMNIRNTKLYFGFFYNDISGTSIIPINKWLHVAFVFDVKSGAQSIYLNGFLDGQRTATGVLKVTSGNFTIGTNEGVVIPNNFYQGYIDQLRMNGRPKSSCEILDLATLAARFTFDNPSPLVDSGPNSVNITASTYSLISSGHINQAISFSGSVNSFFQASGFALLGFSNQSFSISLWILPQALTGTLVHLSTSSTSTGFCFSMLGFASNGALVAQIFTGGATFAAAIGPILPTSSSWIPIVQTWSSSNGLQLYVNNTLASSIPTATSFVTSGATTNYLTLANCQSGCGTCLNGFVTSPGPFNGAIDDWRVYSRELTTSDVCALYLST